MTSDSPRRFDWRFLLPDPQDEAAAGTLAIGFPGRRTARRARGRLGPGGQLFCHWRLPRPWAARRARESLRRAGFAAVGTYRTGPGPGRPELWLPTDAERVAAALLAGRPPRSRRDALLRRAWRLLGPVHAVGRVPEAEAGAGEIPNAEAWALLTGGSEDDAKVVGLPIVASRLETGVVVKFARVAKAEVALEREAELLRALERERPALAGVPRLRGTGRRGGRLAVIQDAIAGRSLDAGLDAAGFAAAAPAVGRWLAELAGDPAPQPASSWTTRLVAEPLAELRRLRPDAEPLAERAAIALASLEDLPLVWEHRDFGPWNVILADRSPAAIDWEDAEPRGLPGLDLAYFLASCAFAVGGGHDAAKPVENARRRNASLRDPATELGAVAAAVVAEYRTALGVSVAAYERLRLLAWLTQALIAARRAAAGGAPAAADLAIFLALAEDELQLVEERS